MNTSTKPATAPIRRSCQFCRSRKIRCSGHNICTACSERKLDCVYGAESGKGRPRGSVSKSISRPIRKSSPTRGARSEAIFNEALEKGGNNTSGSTDSAETHQGSGLASKDAERSQVINTLASELIQMFDENFAGDDAPKTNVYQNALAKFNRRLDKDPSGMISSLVGTSPESVQEAPVMSYDGLLSFMTLELVEMLSERFGSLGCHNNDDDRKRFYVLSLAKDQTPTMFEPVLPEANPLEDLDNHRILQMIEIWFSVHPLSTIISKTLLLRDIRNNTHDTILLAVILADAGHAQSGHTELVDEESLFSFAAAQLHERPSSSWNISTAQALLLFGWHELCVGHARRATCYIGYAGRIATKLNIDLSKQSLSGQGQINGVDIGAVEGELVQNIYWMSFAITLWSFMQMDQPFSFLLPKNIPTAFPSMDESSSALTKLNIASNNIATLQCEAKALRELWPLSHITSTIAHIYALYPRNKDPNESSTTESWQNRPIHQLRQLLDVHQDVSALCVKLRRVLLDAIKSLDDQVRAPSSKTVIVIAYHTMIIHMLFPRQEYNSPVTMTEAIVEEFCSSAQALLDIGASIEEPQKTSNLLVGGLQASTVTDTFALGLEVCGRAMKYMHKRFSEGSPIEREVVLQRRQELAKFAEIMHDLIQSETFRGAKRFQIVKRALKQAKLSLRDSGVAYQRSGTSSSHYASSSTEDSSIPGPESEGTMSVPTPLQGIINDPLPLDFDNTALGFPGADTFDAMIRDGSSTEPFPIDWFQFNGAPQMQDGMLNMPKPYTIPDGRFGDPLSVCKPSVPTNPLPTPQLSEKFDPLIQIPSYPSNGASNVQIKPEFNRQNTTTSIDIDDVDSDD